MDFSNVIHMHNIARTFTCYTIAQSIYDISPDSHVYIALDGGGESRMSHDEDGPATWAFVVFSYDAFDQISLHGFYRNTLKQGLWSLPI